MELVKPMPFAEAEQLGLIEPGQELQPIERDFNEGLQASTRGLEPDLLSMLMDEFGEQVEIKGDTIAWKSRRQTT